MLREEGECMGQQELEECLHLLVGDSNFKTALAEDIKADDFAEDVLGFEEVEELEGSGEEDEGAMGGSSQINPYSAAMGIIPEENI